MKIGKPTDLLSGGACAFELPTTGLCARAARTLLTDTMRAFNLPGALVEDAVVAVSEIATNAHRHARAAQAADSVCAPELWIWTRSAPSPQMVVSVYDADRSTTPVASCADLLEEHGKGLTIVAALSSDQGWHRSRSRLRAAPAPGKCAWFALALPANWPSVLHPVRPTDAADRLRAALDVRGTNAARLLEAAGMTIVADEISVQVTPCGFTWKNGDGELVRRPLSDLEDTAERLISQIESANEVRPGP
ncbi:ATP-binding protein [Spirillospora sp. NPDC047279]|uniref:ATP-binding protein n=1 Tax=Spirillospora sp. NPDC047279 TaxID=3155478 RepID=UPI0033EF50E2